jgi:uncharacterized protein YbgA (DUF1722 family)
MKAWAKRRARLLEKENLSGFILKSKSPSCGLKGAKVYTQKGRPPLRKGTGLFARALLERFPNLPVIDERRLHTPAIRDNFIVRLFAYRRLHNLVKGMIGLSAFRNFHECQKLLLLSHGPKHYKELNALVDSAASPLRKAFLKKYEALFMEALQRKATHKKHEKVFRHVLKDLKNDLSGMELREFRQKAESYGNGDFPLIIPLTLLVHFAAKYRKGRLQCQSYLNPNPLELLLRYHS